MGIFYSLFLFIIFISFLFPKGRVVFLINSLFLWILLAFNRGGSDYSGYVSMFNFFGTRSVQIDFQGDSLWKLLNHLFYQLSFTVDNFLFVLLTCAVVSYMLFIQKYAKHPNIVVALTSIYPLVDNVIQKRFFLAMVIFIWIVPICLRYRSSYQRFVYCTIIIYLSYMIHSGFALMMLILIPIFFMNKEFKPRMFLIFAILSTAFSLVALNIAPLFISSGKLFLYFENSSLKTSLWKLLVHILIVLLYATIGYFIYHYLSCETEEEQIQNRLFMWLSAGMLLFSPLILYNSTFFRFPRVLFLFVLIMFANLFTVQNHKIKLRTLNILLCMLGFHIGMFFLMYVFTGNHGFDALVLPLIESNEVLQYLLY